MELAVVSRDVEGAAYSSGTMAGVVLRGQVFFLPVLLCRGACGIRVRPSSATFGWSPVFSFFTSGDATVTRARPRVMECADMSRCIG